LLIRGSTKGIGFHPDFVGQRSFKNEVGRRTDKGPGSEQYRDGLGGWENVIFQVTRAGVLGESFHTTRRDEELILCRRERRLKKSHPGRPVHEQRTVEIPLGEGVKYGEVCQENSSFARSGVIKAGSSRNKIKTTT